MVSVCVVCCVQRARRTKRSFFPWLLTLMLVACAWFKLVTLSSTLNKMNYQGTWCATNDNLDIKYTFNPQSAVSLFARISHACAPECILQVGEPMEQDNLKGRVRCGSSQPASCCYDGNNAFAAPA